MNQFATYSDYAEYHVHAGMVASRCYDECAVDAAGTKSQDSTMSIVLTGLIGSLLRLVWLVSR